MFSLSTCVPCKTVKPILEKLDAEYGDLTVSYTVVDKEENGRALAEEWDVKGVPTLIFIQDREEKSRSVGQVNEETLRRYVEGFVEKIVKKLTHAQYEEKLLEAEIDFFPVEPYINTTTKIIHECLKGHQWSVLPQNILRGSGCPVCSDKIQKLLIPTLTD